MRNYLNNCLDLKYSSISNPLHICSSSKPPPGPIQQLKGKSGSSQGSSYPVQRQSSRVRKSNTCIQFYAISIL